MDDWSQFGDNQKTKQEWYDYLVESSLETYHTYCNFRAAQRIPGFNITQSKCESYRKLIVSELKKQFDKIAEVGTYSIERRVLVSIAYPFDPKRRIIILKKITIEVTEV